ncbi:hypothetical protein CJI97_000631 [Candidozyma auris]|nr:hypothetical protein CJI97_000631 [[Candida] auris]
MAEKEKRRLRSQENSRATSKLFDFDYVNGLLFKNEPLYIDRAKFTNRKHQPYRYYKDLCRLPEKLAISKPTKVTKKEVVLPRRQRTKRDPLSDDVYLPFHRKMKRDEKSMTGSDKNRIANEVDNFKMQLMLLQQNTWARHLPKITYINDKSNPAELQWKRSATFAELQRLVQKYENWDQRNEQCMADIKEFESRKDSNEADSEPVEEDDSDEAIMANQYLQQEREEERLSKFGPSSRLVLHNGYDLVFGPFIHPRIEPSVS